MVAIDPYSSFTASGPRDEFANDAFNVVPNDNEDVPFVTRAIWVTTPGTLRVRTVAGTIVNLPALPTGFIGWPIKVTRIYATGTTATGIVGLV